MQLNETYWTIDKLPGISQKDYELLLSNGINNTKDLLAQAKNTQGKQALASKLQINLKYINKWTALADLALRAEAQHHNEVWCPKGFLKDTPADNRYAYLDECE